MSTLEYGGEATPRRGVSIAILLAGVVFFAGALTLDLKTSLLGGVLLVASVLIAAREARAPAITWPNVLAAFVLLVWLIPIRTYRLPFNLPFHLEIYRMAIVLLVGVFVLLVLSGRARLSAGGIWVGLSMAAFAAAVLLSQFFNLRVLDPRGGEGHAMKSLLFILAFLVVLILAASTIRDRRGADRVAQALVVGAVLVSLGAIYESRTGYNVFDHLSQWVPGLRLNGGYEAAARRGVLRVNASSQHPIALGTALALVLPLAVYLATRARSVGRAVLWACCGGVIAIGSLLPVARTVVVMAAVMVVIALVFRRRQVVRYWPVLIVAVAALHVASPGVIGAVYKSFTPSGGLAADATGRAGLPGSGRLSDVGPGIDLWKESPIVGIGLGNAKLGGTDSGDPRDSGIIFDDQYLSTLVPLGALGLAALVSLLAAMISRQLRPAFRRSSPDANLALACGLSAAGFAASMFLFDAFSFVQVTLVFFLICGLGLGAAARARAHPPEPSGAAQ